MKWLLIGIIGLLACLAINSSWQNFNSIPELPLTPPAKAIRPEEKSDVPDTKPQTGVLELKDIDLNKGHTVYLTSQVNTESAKQVIDGIFEGNKKNKPIYLLIDSPGGSVFDGARIISAIQASRNPVYTVCLESCASMAAMILEYGYERYAVDRSVLMFHPASLTTMVNGDLDKIVSKFLFLKRYIDKMDYYVATRSGSSYDAFKNRSNYEYYIDAEDALAYNLIDDVVRLIDFQGVSSNFGQGRSKLELDFTWQ